MNKGNIEDFINPRREAGKYSRDEVERLRQRIESEHERLCYEFGPRPIDGREYDLWQAKIAAAGRMYAMVEAALDDMVNA